MQQRFGKYSLIERLAFGGMAEVFLANVHGEAGFSKPVVIKRLHPRLSEDAEFTRMLIDEARITSQLSHINICQVLDLGQVDGSYFIAMEHVPGEDLRTFQDHYRRQRLYMPVQVAVYVVSELLAGLDYAHSKEDVEGKSLGVIHRDISPQNLLISYEGEVKIIDFGIAKARQRLVQTQAGVIKGKFRYMSPEQAAGGDVDHRADLFAAGVVLYELLRGEPHSLNIPDTEVLRRMRDAEFEPLKRDEAEVPRPLMQVVRRALQRQARKRFGSAAEFRQALVALQPTLPPVFRGQTVPFGRAELAVLMKRTFPLERRRRRSGGTQRAAQAVREGGAPRRAMDATGVAGDQGSAPERGISEQALGEVARSENHSAPLLREGTTPISELDGSPARPAHMSDPPRFGPSTPATAGSMTAVREPSAETLARDAQGGKSGRLPHGRDLDLPLLDPLERPSDEDLSTFAAATRLRPDPTPIPLSSPDTHQDAESAEAEARSRPRERGAGAFSRHEPVLPERHKPERHKGGAPSPPPEPTEPVDPLSHPSRLSNALPVPQRGHSTRVNLPSAARGSGGVWKGVALTLFLLALVAGAFVAGRYALNWPMKLPWDTSPKNDAGEPPSPEEPEQVLKETGALGRGFAQVRIESVPSGAQVQLCGRSVRQPTPVLVRVRRGRLCALRLELTGYKPHQSQVRFDQRRPSPIEVTLSRATPPQRQDLSQPNLSKQGTIVVTAIRMGTVYVNGVAMGKTPRLELPLTPGQYSVWVEFPALGIQTGARIVHVTVGERQTLHFDPGM